MTLSFNYLAKIRENFELFMFPYLKSTSLAGVLQENLRAREQAAFEVNMYVFESFLSGERVFDNISSKGNSSQDINNNLIKLRKKVHA